MNSLLQKQGCTHIDIVVKQQLESKIVRRVEYKVYFFGKVCRCKCLTLGGGDETWNTAGLNSSYTIQDKYKHIQYVNMKIEWNEISS